MGLTRPRAYQIFDIDYKQSVRAVSTSNVTLASGAPATVDGVSLNVNDRVLVTGQSTGSENGLYYVTTVGGGGNGTWQRSVDGNETGEIESGMIVMVTEGSLYADTQWKLTTNDPIVIGTTALTFVQNYSANTISSGTSNVVVNSNANVTVSSAGTSNVLVISNVGANISGFVTATGNITGDYILGNGALLTGVITSVANINNGTSNVTVVGAGGDITVGVGGTGNVGVFSSTGLAITGDLSVTGNATLSGNILGDRIQNGNTQIDIQTQNGNANITVGGVSNVAVFSTLGQDIAGYLTATGNVTGGNLTTTGLVSATGNITGNYFIGNGSQLTGISADTIGGNVTVLTRASGNVNFDVVAGYITILARTGSVQFALSP